MKSSLEDHARAASKLDMVSSPDLPDADQMHYPC